VVFTLIPVVDEIRATFPVRLPVGDARTQLLDQRPFRHKILLLLTAPHILYFAEDKPPRPVYLRRLNWLNNIGYQWRFFNAEY